MRQARHSVVVPVPIAAAYKQWIDVESFPLFFHPVSSVSQTAEAYTHWVVTVGRIVREFDAEIVEQIPDDHVTWRTIGGDLAFTARADFVSDGDGSTRVTLTVDWDPGSAAERAAAAVGVDGRVVRSALRSYARYLEKTGGPKGRSHVTIRSVDREDPPPANAPR
ncbi:SRPBCC family protein [Herbiconiux liangxiaofengii]|uniref:SRPBCC family protein n=1 Tax=Herbiconiux liangxiaofengii TaxID=3342795 RepID=UPI0035B7FB71